MRIATTLGGICIVRNARDLIAFSCGHYLRIGLGHVRFIDDGSSDGTYEFLTKLARKEPRLSVSRVCFSEFRQPELMSEAANELLRSFSMILPFDVDEFWNIHGPSLENAYAQQPDILLVGKWINFVQSDRATKPRAVYLLGVKHAAPILSDANQATITTLKRPFVCFSTTKVGFKSTQPVALGIGQHELTRGPTEQGPHTYEIFHLPFTNKSQLITRAEDHEPRRAPLRGDPAVNWQSRFFREAVLAGRTDDLWRANSADKNGFLNCHGERIELKPDHRLQTLFLKGYAHLVRQHQMFLL